MNLSTNHNFYKYDYHTNMSNGGSVKMDVELTTVGERGQAVIPKSIRDQMPAPKGTLFSIVMIDKDTLILKRVDKKKLLGEFRDLRASVQKLKEADILAEIRKP